MSIKKKSVNIKDLVIKEVEFNGDTLLAVQDKKKDKIYIGVSYICTGIGLTKSQKDTQVQFVQSDRVLSKGCLKFQAGVLDANNEAFGIELDFLPLWLAKINITPKMEKENPDVADKLESYQIHVKDVLANYFLADKKKKEEWNLLREVGKIDRKRMTASIDKNIPDSPNKRFAYPNHTNMIYRVLFNKDAKKLRSERNKETNESLRDSFIDEELRLVDEAETIVTALLAIGFSFDEIKLQLQKRFTKSLNNN